MAQPDHIEMTCYRQFQTRLLKGIKMEEKSFLPEAQKANPEILKELIPRRRLDYGGITALMVPSLRYLGKF